MVSKKQIGYYRARLRNRFHQLVLEKFKASGISRAELSRRLYKRPEVVTRLLGAPGNCTLDTLSDLLLGLGYEPVTAASAIAQPAHQGAQVSILGIPIGTQEQGWQELPNKPEQESSVLFRHGQYREPQNDQQSQRL